MHFFLLTLLYSILRISPGVAPLPAAFAPAPVIAPAPVAVDIGSVAVAGEKCVDKIITVEEIESEDQVECKHRYWLNYWHNL